MVYYCAECGYWQDARLAKALTDMLNQAAASLAHPSPVGTPVIYPCPYGHHGPMLRLLDTDRVFVRAGVIDAPTGRELAAIGH